MSAETEIYELAEKIHKRIMADLGHGVTAGDAEDAAWNIVNLLRADGWTKPRTITTVEELATLPLESVIIDAARCIGEMESVSGNRTWWSLTGDEFEISDEDLDFPVTVLWEPLP